MATDYELREAYEKGAKEGATTERERLRVFAGLRYIAMPKDYLPEHQAYPEYELRLRDVLAKTEREGERLRARNERLIEANGKASQAYDEAVDAHRAGRESAGVFGKLKSVITEPFLREKSLAAAAEARLQDNWQAIIENEATLDLVRTEYGAVSAWVDEMYTFTMAAGQSRAEDRIAAARDISSRNFKVFTMEDYLNGDERRRLTHIPDVPAGEIFGSRWRRDGDDRPSHEDGIWCAVWIPENEETALFVSSEHRPAEVWLLGDHISTRSEATKLLSPQLARINERNSLALVMDAYTEAHLERP